MAQTNQPPTKKDLPGAYCSATTKDHSIGLFRRDPGSTAEPSLEAASIGTLLGFQMLTNGTSFTTIKYCNMKDLEVVLFEWFVIECWLKWASLVDDMKGKAKRRDDVILEHGKWTQDKTKLVVASMNASFKF